MKSKVFTIPASGINSAIQQVDVSLFVGSYVIDGEVKTENSTYYPIQIFIKNNSGVKIGFLTFSSEKEETIYNQNPDWFQWIPIEDKSFANNLNVGRVKKVHINKLSTSTANGEVELVCMEYKNNV